ncbi:MAG: hypothetical protein HYT72_04800 [Candidatus Aenigmarchaeota archaeon]|nr:hypothetical protein [Candidatus Aenigmarchaeota archaeon]
MALIGFLLLLSPVYAFQANFEKAGLGRVVGDSAQELLDQMKAADLTLRHATYYTDEYLPVPAYPGAEPGKPPERFSDINDTLRSYFGNNVKTAARGWDWGDVTDSVKNFKSNELFIIEIPGKIKNDAPAAYTGLFFGDLKPGDTAWADKFKSAKPLFLFDSDYAGLYLPRSVDGSNSFVGQLGQDAVIISPTAIPDKEFVKSFICYLGRNNLLGNNSVGEIFRDARNAYYWQSNAPSGLSLMSYELYGNPQLRALLNNVDKQVLLKNCAPYIQEETIKASALSVAGFSPLSLYENYVLENTLSITSYTLENENNFTIISVGGMQQDKVIDDVILPRKADIEEFPLKTLIANVSVVSLENPVELVINLSMWNGTAATERACWFDKREAGISYTHTFTEDAELVITNIKPVEIVNCTEGRVRLYQTVKYKIEYNPFSSVLIKKIEAPPEVLPDSIAAINVTVKNLRTSSVSGILSISGNNNTINSASITFAPNEVKTIPITFKTDKAISSYAVNYIEDNEVKTSKKFRIMPRVLDMEINAVPYQASGLLVPVGLSFNNRLSEQMSIEFDISLVDSSGANYKPLHLPLTLLPGKNTKFVKLETADMPAGMYSLLLSVTHPYGNSIVTKTIEIVSVDYKVAAGSVNSFSDGSTEKKTATSVAVPRDVVIKNANIELSGYPSAVYNLYPVNITLYVGNLSAVQIYGKLIGNEVNLDQFTNRKTEETVSSAEEAEVTRYIKVMKNSTLHNAAIGIGESLGSSGMESAENVTRLVSQNTTVKNASVRYDGASFVALNATTIINGTRINLGIANVTSDSSLMPSGINDYCSNYYIDSGNANWNDFWKYFNWFAIGLWCANDWKFADIDNDGYSEKYALPGITYRIWSRCEANSNKGFKVKYFSDYNGNVQEYCTYDHDYDRRKSQSYCGDSRETTYRDKQYNSLASTVTFDDLFCYVSDGSTSIGYGWRGGEILWCYDLNGNGEFCDSGDRIEPYLIVNCGVDNDCASDKYCKKPSISDPATYSCDTPSCQNLNCPEWKEQENTYSNHACNSQCNLKQLRCETPGQELDETHYCDSNHYIQSGTKKIVKVNGAQVWKGFGIKQENLDITSKVKEFLSGCTADSEGYCNVPIQFTSNFATWGLKVNSIAAKYIPAIEIGDAIQRYLSTCSENPCQMSISTLSYMSGTLTFLNPIIQYESYNYKPVVDLNSNISINEGEAANLNLHIMDMAGENFTVSVSPPFNNSDVWQTDYNSAGEYDVNVQVQDSAYTVQKSAKVRVKDVNRPPTLKFVDDVQAAEKENVTLAVDTSDPDGDELTYSASDPRFVGGNVIADNFERADIKPWIAKQINDGASIDIKDGALDIRTVDDGPNIPTVGVLPLLQIPANFNFSMKFNSKGSLSGPFFKIGDNNTGKWIGVRTSRTTFLHLMENVKPLDDFYDDWDILINGNAVFTAKYTYNASLWHTIRINKNVSSYIILLDNITLWSGVGDNFETVNYVSVENGQGSGKWPIRTDIYYDDMQIYFPEKLSPVGLGVASVEPDNAFTWQTQEGDAGNYTVNVAVSDGKSTVFQNVLVTVSAAPAIPSEYWGNVTINGSLVPNGTAIEAYINNALFATMAAVDGFYDVTIPADDSGTPEKEGGVENDTIVVKINGAVAKPFLSWKPGIYRTDIWVNRAPLIEKIENITVNETEMVQIKPMVTDPDNDSTMLFYSAPLNSSGAWQTDYNSAGEYGVNVTASDGIDNATQTVKIIVKNLNRPPVLAHINNVTVKENETVVIIPGATDPDGGELIFSFATPLNSNGTWKTTFNDAGIYVVAVSVSDGELSDEQNITITVLDVNAAPVLNPVNDQTVAENGTLIITLNATDPDEDILVYSTNASKGSMVNDTYAWHTTFEDAGIYHFGFAVSDGSLSDSKTVKIVVSNVDRPPKLAQIGNKVVEEGQLLAFAIAAADPDNDILIYSVNDTRFNLANNAVSWQTGYDDAGVYPVLIAVSDGTLQDSQALTITVIDTNRAPLISLVPFNGTSFNETDIIRIVASASDPDNDTITYSIKIDGKEVSTNNSYQWITGYEDAGSHIITAAVSDGKLMASKEHAVIISDTIKSFSLPLAGEWNLISVPVRPMDTAIKGVLSSLDGNYNGIFAFADNEWKTYNPEKPEFLNKLKSINETLGFWIYMQAADTLQVYGISLNVPIQLKSGWNLAGYPYITSMETTKAMASINSKYRSVFAYDSSLKGWKTYTPEKPDFLNSLKNMSPGSGYWIDAITDAAWKIGQSAQPLALGILSSQSANSQSLLPPSEYWGNAAINSSLAPNGTAIKAYINGTLFATMAAVNGFYDIVISSDDPATAEKEGGIDNDTITIKINGITARPSLKWKSGIQRADIRANMAPVISAIGNKTVSENMTLRFSVSITDDDNVTIAAFSLPLGATFDGNEFSWIPNFNQSGIYQVTFNASDGDLSDTETITITVNDVNRQPVIASSPVTKATEEISYLYDIDAVDEDINTKTGDKLSFSLLQAPENMTMDSITGIISWNPTNAQAGDSYIVKVTVADSFGASAAQTFEIAVENNNDMPIITSVPITKATEEELYKYDVESDDDDFRTRKPKEFHRYSLDISPVGMTISSSTGIISWMPTNEQAAKSHAVIVKATDSNGSYVLQTYQIYVENVNDAPELNAIGGMSVNEGELLAFTIVAKDPDPVNDVLTYSAYNLPQGAAFNNQVFSWTPGLGQVGAYQVTFVVSDGKLSDTETIYIKVSKKADLSGNSITTNYTAYSIDFGSSYSSIGSICFDFTLSNNPLDPGEKLSYSMIPAPASYSYGFVNSKNTSQSKLFGCITPSHAGYSEFLDGKVAGSVWMERGTVYVQSLIISLENAVKNTSKNNPTPPPPSSPSPAPSCSLSANPYSGVGPFNSITTVNYSNLIASPNTITINCNSTVIATGCSGTTGSCSAVCNYPSVTSSIASIISASASGTVCSPACVKVNPLNALPSEGGTDACLAGNSITTNYTAYSIDFGSTYSSIGSICFDFTLSSDLLDTGENLDYTMVPAPASYSYGFVNSKNTSQSTLFGCITPSHAGYSEFLDGKVAGSVWMERGTVFIQSLVISLENAVKK